jgi:hypothetical protein
LQREYIILIAISIFFKELAKMAKIYLTRGRRFVLNGACVAVCSVGRDIDVAIDWFASAELTGNNPDGRGDGIGTVVIDGMTFDVIVELSTGQFWYDDERGY